MRTRRYPVPGNPVRIPEPDWTEAERWAVDWLRSHPEESVVETESFRAIAGLSAGQRLFAVDRKPNAVPEDQWTDDERDAVSRLKRIEGERAVWEERTTEQRTHLFRVVMSSTDDSGEPRFAVYRKPEPERAE